MKPLYANLLLFLSPALCLAQNVGINTDGTTPETGVMLDVKTTSSYSTTAGPLNVFQIKSFDASATAMKLRLFMRTHATAGLRYGGFEVYDAASAAYRTLALQPSGGFVGVANTAPATLFANTSTNTLDLAGIGISSSSLAWLTNAQGYVTSLVNTDATANGRNGLLVKTAATDAASFPLQVNVGTNNALTIRGDRNIGIGTTTPAAKLEIQGSSGSTLKIVDGNQGANKVLTSDAAGQASWQTLTSLPGTCMQNVWAQYTAGTYTFTTSASTTKIFVELWGGGGGGSNSVISRTGGGGGAYAAAFITVTPSTNYTVVVGAAGVAHTSNGGNSTFNSTVLVAGGGVRGNSTAAGGTATTTLGSGNAILISGEGGTSFGYYDHTGWVNGSSPDDYGFGGAAGGTGGGRGGCFMQTGGAPGGGGGTQGGNGAAGGAVIRW